MMSSLARRMASSSLCGASQSQHSPGASSALPYPKRMEKVKFGAPLESVCGAHNDIPGPLLVMILKLNKEAPFKKDVFRAPGHQANMKKLIHFLQNGRLVNIDNYSVYTIASVLKKFLRKLPSGVFGPENEQRLFEVIAWTDNDRKREEIQRVFASLPIVTQHFLVLLFGTFRSMASASDRAHTGMTSEAIGVSVAPSFFQSCVQGGHKFAKMEDVTRFKVATTIMKFLIDNFGVSDLFGRANYEYYARMSGHVLKVEQNLFFAFKHPNNDQNSRESALSSLSALSVTCQTLLAPRNEWHALNTCYRWGLPSNSSSARPLRAIGSADECQSTPTLCSGQSTTPSQHVPLMQYVDDSYARLSMSLEENVFKSTHSSPHNSQQVQAMCHQNREMAREDVMESESHLPDLKSVNRYAESTKSLTFLPIVHERQTQRMKTRSEWFLNPTIEGVASTSGTQQANRSTSSVVRRTSSKEKRLVRRSSSKKDGKENGNRVGEREVGTSLMNSETTLDPILAEVLQTQYKPRI